MFSKIKANPKEKRKETTCMRSNCCSFLGLWGCALFLTGTIGNLVQKGYDGFPAVFLVHDIMVILTTGSVVLFFLVYAVLGWNYNAKVVYEIMRVGRRTCMHLVHVLILPVFMNLFMCLIELIWLDKQYGKTIIDGRFIFLGFTTNTVMSPFKPVYMIGGWIIGIILLFFYLADFFRSGTFHYLMNTRAVRGVYDFIDGQRRLGPRFVFHVTCYHYETRTRTVSYTDSEGNQQTKTETYTERVNTYSESRVWQYRKFADASGEFLLDAAYGNRNFIKVRLTYDILFANEVTRNVYARDLAAFHVENRWRDTHMDTSETKTVPGFISRVMANLREDGSRPFWANVYFYCLCSFLVPFQMCFRYAFDMLCGEQEFLLRKVVSVTDEVQCAELDQTFDMNYVIVPDWKNLEKNKHANVVVKHDVIDENEPLVPEIGDNNIADPEGDGGIEVVPPNAVVEGAVNYGSVVTQPPQMLGEENHYNNKMATAPLLGNQDGFVPEMVQPIQQNADGVGGGGDNTTWLKDSGV